MDLLVEPSVSRRKFEREVAKYRDQRAHFEERGVWLIEAEYPQIFFVFGSPRLSPAPILFGALLDFSNFDLWPPSVRLVNPFTRESYRWKQLLPAQRLPHVVNGQLQTLLQGGQPDDIPFLCLPGVREYHEHPAHTGDSWLLYRAAGERGLLFIIEQLHKYGVTTAAYDYQLKVHVQLGLGNVPE